MGQGRGRGSSWGHPGAGTPPSPCRSPSLSARNTKLRLLVMTSNFWSPMLVTREMEETGMNRLE